MNRPPAVLIVEPDADTRLMYSLSLRDMHVAVDEASDGAQALAVALSRPPDVVITELRMPRIDGLALCSLLRRDEQTRDTALIVVTGSSSDEAVRTAQDRGADAVIIKPCSPDKLLSTVLTVLQSRGRQQCGTAVPDVEPRQTVRRRTMSRAHMRGRTQAPPSPPPPLQCPRCDASLQYQHTEIGGVNDRFAERWDYFSCASCGLFQYRHRTRKLRSVAGEHTA